VTHILQTDACSQKEAMVITMDDAFVAQRAMVAVEWSICEAFRAIPYFCDIYVL
jgi:hypothetical protein